MAKLFMVIIPENSVGCRTLVAKNGMIRPSNNPTIEQSIFSNQTFLSYLRVPLIFAPAFAGVRHG
jgi:hypothetical protein